MFLVILGYYEVLNTNANFTKTNEISPFTHAAICNSM